MPRARAHSKFGAVLCAFFCLAARQTANAGSVAGVDVSFDARSSLFYYLECVTGGISCSQAEIRQLFSDIFGSAEAENAAADWAAAMNKYAIRVRLNETPSVEWPDFGPDDSASIDLRLRLQEIELTGGSTELMHEKLRVIMNEADIRTLDEILDSLWPAYADWWSREELEWKGYAEQLEEILNNDAARTLQSATGMFGDTLAVPLTVHLIPSPVQGAVNRAFQKGRRSFVEFWPDEDATSRVAVIVHEFCHYLLEAAPESLHRQRMDAFLASEDPTAASAFAVMNEVLATAIGNGMFMKRHLDPQQFRVYMARPDSLYADPAVDRSAKAVLPLVEEYSRSDKVLDRQFFDQYFLRVRTVFEGEPLDPRIALRTSQFYYTVDELESLAIDAAGRYGLPSVYFDKWSAASYPKTIGGRFEALPIAILAGDRDYLPVLRFFVPGSDLPTAAGVPASSCKAQRQGGGWVFLFVVKIGQSAPDLDARIPDCQTRASN